LSLELSTGSIYLILAVLSLNCLSFINKFFSGSILQSKGLSFFLHTSSKQVLSLEVCFANIPESFHLSVKLYLPIFGKTKLFLDYC